MERFINKYAVVTGGAKGIGRAVVQRFIKEGINGIAILDYDDANMEKTASEFSSDRQKIKTIHCDIGDMSSIIKAFEKVAVQLPRVDILINNAGILRDVMMHKMDESQWDIVLNVNLKGAWQCMEQVIPGMRERQYGRIVSVSSISAWGNVGQANYAASKAGLLGLTASAAKELGRKNITVNAVAPGYIDTDIIKTVPQKIQDSWLQQIPLQRFGRPEEIASVIAFLASDDASYVSGSCVACNGGVFSSF